MRADGGGRVPPTILARRWPRRPQPVVARGWWPPVAPL